MNIKFLLDVNASGAVNDYLIRRGYDVKLVSDEDIRMSDSKAVDEDRVIITTDKDFEGMVWKENRKHTGILRLENVPRNERLKLLSRVLQNWEEKLVDKAIVIATRSKIRIRH